MKYGWKYLQKRQDKRESPTKLEDLEVGDRFLYTRRKPEDTEPRRITKRSDQFIHYVFEDSGEEMFFGQNSRWWKMYVDKLPPEEE
jgi:hypothetical protein